MDFREEKKHNFILNYILKLPTTAFNNYYITHENNSHSILPVSFVAEIVRVPSLSEGGHHDVTHLGLGVLLDGCLDGPRPAHQELKLVLCQVHAAELQRSHQLALHGALKYKRRCGLNQCYVSGSVL